jgi:hypothetical protein
MATVASNVQDALTGSGTQDEIYTGGAGINKAAATIAVANESGVTRSLKLFIGGVTAAHQIGNDITILAGETALLNVVSGPSAKVSIEASGADCRFNAAILQETS